MVGVVRYSVDGGDTWGGEVDDGALLNPQCKATVTRMPHQTVAPFNPCPGVAYIGADSSNMSAPYARVNITIKFSNNSGSSWVRYKQEHAHAHSHACIRTS